ncbi:MAG: hypothetical protein AB8B96_17580 [Lysobacterales bacterium]
MSAIPLFYEIPTDLREGTCNLLTELADVLLAHGVKISDLEPLVRKSMVDAASRKLEREGERPTSTNVGLQTGLTRDKVSTYMRQKPGEISGRLSPIARVLDEWQRGKRWRDESGPRDLPLTGPRSFEALTKECKVSGYSVKALMEYMEASNNIERLENGDLRLKRLGAVPDDMHERTLAMFRNVSKHLSTCSHNLRCNPEDRMYEQVAGRLNVPPRRIAAALEALSEEGRRSNRKVNNDVFPQFEAQTDHNADFGTDIGMGWFTFIRKDG